MGTLSWSVTEAGRINKDVQSTRHTASGAFTTSTAAANITSLSLSVGDVIVVHASVAMRIRFGATAATASTGHYLPAATQCWFEVAPGDSGAVSVIDLA